MQLGGSPMQTNCSSTLLPEAISLDTLRQPRSEIHHLSQLRMILKSSMPMSMHTFSPSPCFLLCRISLECSWYSLPPQHAWLKPDKHWTRPKQTLNIHRYALSNIIEPCMISPPMFLGAFWVSYHMHVSCAKFHIWQFFSSVVAPSGTFPSDCWFFVFILNTHCRLHKFLHVGGYEP